MVNLAPIRIIQHIPGSWSTVSALIVWYEFVGCVAIRSAIELADDRWRRTLLTRILCVPHIHGICI